MAIDEPRNGDGAARNPGPPRWLAELTDHYSNFDLPLLHTLLPASAGQAPTLVDQSAGLSAFHPAADLSPPATAWRSTLPHLEAACELYQQGYSLTAISKKLGIAWESVARLLERGGLRERRHHPSE